MAKLRCTSTVWSLGGSSKILYRDGEIRLPDFLHLLTCRIIVSRGSGYIQLHRRQLQWLLRRLMRWLLLALQQQGYRLTAVSFGRKQLH